MRDDDRPSMLDVLREWLDASPAELGGLAVLLLGAALLSGVLWWAGTPRPATDHAPALPAAILVDDEVVTDLVVHIAGAVVDPGIVTLPEGARVDDAIRAAGGLAPDADPSTMNFARVVHDGEQVYVPTVGEVAAHGDRGAAWRPDGRLDLNRASAADLEELPGVGPVLASRIVEWREANGPFIDVEQLLEVSGIGQRTFAALADLVAV